MKKIKLITIVGARPQFVKAAALSREIKKHSSIEEVIVHTGQHFDENMSNVFFNEMQIPKPKYNLGINSFSHGKMTGMMLEEIEKILLLEKPDLLLVYGDTNSTLAGSLAAKKLHIKVAHVEAGLRSFNIKMPEEVNRILTDRISDLLFCPTETSIKNLENEGFNNFDATISNVGDVMYDCALFYAGLSSEKSTILNDIKIKDFILCTIHREENTNDPKKLSSIVESLNELHNDIEILVPLHPRTRKIINELGLNISFKTIDPVGYFDMIELLKNCKMVITDSGGLQKEAYFFKKNCITLREQTEWIELVNNKVNILVGSNKNDIIKITKLMLNEESDFSSNLYGDGNACKKICNEIISYFS